MNRLRWRLSSLLENLSRRIEWWAECVAPKSNERLDLSDILLSIEPTDTPFLRGINRTNKEWWNTETTENQRKPGD